MRPTLLPALILSLGCPLSAQTQPATATPPPGATPAYSDAELDALINGETSPASPQKGNPWLAWWRAHASSELRFNASLGFKDNALYSAFDPQETPFSRTSAEWTVFGLPTASVWQWYGYVMLENVHNFDVPQMRDEQLYMAIAEAKRPIGNSPWKIGAQVQMFHFHQAFDISLNELVSSTSAITLDQAEFRPILEYTPAPNWTVSLQGILSASRFGTPADDYDRVGARLSVARSYAKKGKVEVILTEEYRDYASRTQRTRAGAAIAGTQLERGQLNLEGVWKHPWNAEGSVTTTTKLRHRQEDDNGTGYYDADHWQFSQKITWEPKDWEISLAYKYQRWDYDHQAGAANTLHWRQSDSLEFRAEHALTHAWRIFAAGEFEYSNSDFRNERYPRNLGEIGLSFVY